MIKRKENTMKKAKIYSATVNGETVILKAYLKKNVVTEFKKMDSTIKDVDVHLLKHSQNSHQIPVEER